MITLGTKVKDEVSGVIGIAVSRTEYLNGCIQYSIQPKLKKGETEIVMWNIDEIQLFPVNKRKPTKKKKSNRGGPTTKTIRRRA
jgi:hypothetical protein